MTPQTKKDLDAVGECVYTDMRADSGDEEEMSDQQAVIDAFERIKALLEKVS